MSLAISSQQIWSNKGSTKLQQNISAVHTVVMTTVEMCPNSEFIFSIWWFVSRWSTD